MSEHRKNKAFFFSTVCMNILCLLLAACGPNGDADNADDADDADDADNTDTTNESSQSLAIDPNKFALDVGDRSTNKNNFVAIKITPGGPDMNLREFFVTASIEGDKGIVKGVTNKQEGKGLEYTAELNDCNVATLSYSTRKAKQGDEGSPIEFRAKALPGAAIKQGDKYTLTVKVERKGSNPHTETQSIALTAKQDGAEQKTPTAAKSTAEKMPSHDRAEQKTPTVAKSTAENASTQDDTEQKTPTAAKSTAEKMPSHDRAEQKTPTVAKSTAAQAPMQDDAAQVPMQDDAEQKKPTAAGSTAEHVPTQDDAGQKKPTAAGSTAEHVPTQDDAGQKKHQPTSDRFTVTLKEEKKKSNYKNDFVIVAIKPSNSGMALKDLWVTAFLSDNSGSIKGSSKKNKKSFVYDKTLNNCSLEALLLVDHESRLGAHDTRFKQGEAISFKIKVSPSEAIRPGEPYVLTVKVERKGSNPRIETESIKLEAT